jgi:hypothetical protein
MTSRDRFHVSARIALALFVAYVFVACRASSKDAPSASSSSSAAANTPMNVAPNPLPIAAKPHSSAMDAIPIPAASIASMVNPANLPAYDGPTGSIEGTITVTGDAAPDLHLDFKKCPKAASVHGKVFREGPPGPGGARPLADAVVGVIDVGPSTFFVPEQHDSQEVDIVDCAFSKRTVTLTYGQRLDVANKSQGIFGPVFAQVSTPALMLATQNGDPVKLYPPKPGRYLLIDRMGHEFLTADVFAFLFSLHDSTNLEGHYRIDGVPVGKRKVFTTHPSFKGENAKEIDVRAGVVERVDLSLNYVASENPANPTSGVRRPPTLMR